MDLLFQAIQNQDKSFIDILLKMDERLLFHVFEDGSTFQDVFQSIFHVKYQK